MASVAGGKSLFAVLLAGLNAMGALTRGGTLWLIPTSQYASAVP
jgi:hypothetical protein